MPRLRLAPGLLLLAALLGALSGAEAASLTYLQGRVTSDSGQHPPLLTVGLDLETDLGSTTTEGGFFVIGGLIDGARDRVKISGEGFETYLGPTFYAGVEPITGQEHLIVATTSRDDWAKALDSDGTLDDTKGIVYGEVEDASGAPVAGATVSISPGPGDVFYFDDAGKAAPLATQTGATGRYLILNVPPGDIEVDDQSGNPPLRRAYGRVAADTVTGLILRPTLTVSGTTVDVATGGDIPGVLVAWDFPTDFPPPPVTSDPRFTFPGLADGLDMTLRATADPAGPILYRPALTFRNSFSELFDPAALKVELLGEDAYSGYPAEAGVVQDPNLGMIVGRVLTADGMPLAGAIVTSDPAVGQIAYFDGDLVRPIDDLHHTTLLGQGRFVIFDVPPGNVVLSAVGPNETIRGELASSEAGVVTSGELRGFPLITVKGKILDEVFHSATIGGAVISLVEYPNIVNIAGVDGTFTLSGVPAGEFVTFRVERADFKSSYSFTQKTPTSDLACLDTTDRSDCKDFFIISETGFNALFTSAKLVANRSLGLISAGVFLSNGVAAMGVQAQLTPNSGSLRYLTAKKGTGTEVTSVGAVQIFNATPSIAGVALFDPRWDSTTIVFARVVADAITLTDKLRVACDTHTAGTFSNIYPCDGARMTVKAKDAFFQWGVGNLNRCQGAPQQVCTVTDAGTDDCGDNGPCVVFGDLLVQFSADPTFATNSLTFKANLTSQFKHLTAKNLNKLRKLGASGSAVYWHLVFEHKIPRTHTHTTEFVTDPFVFYLP